MSQQTQRVLIALRQMIVDGAFAPGEHLAEVAVAEKLEASRTPVRSAFAELEKEGLLTRAGGRGYTVRAVSPDDIRDAIEVRGSLEGLAAGLLAQRGLPRNVRALLADCLARGDALFAAGTLPDEALEAYHDLNMRFHAAIVEACGNNAVAEALARNDSLPFASANSIAIDRAAADREFDRFRLAHMQHHLVFDALDRGEAFRAETLMREHANAAMRYAEIFGEKPVDAADFRVITGRL